MLDIDLPGLVLSGLLAGQRDPDDLLHCSSDIVGPLRHTMLRLAGAPSTPNSFASLARLHTGTMWHEWLGELLEAPWTAGQPRPGDVLLEVPVNEGLPRGWGGTADILLWQERYEANVLIDLKTIKGEGLTYIERDGAKIEHIAQVSAYYHALVAMGYPMLDTVGVLYVPMNDDYKATSPLEPLLQEIRPLDKAALWPSMEDRRELCDRYLASLKDVMIRASGSEVFYPNNLSLYLTDELAAPMPRVQKLMKDKDKWNVVMSPHWTSMFCPFDDRLCPCGGLEGEARTTKVGTFEKGEGGWVYTPRAGFELVEPEVAPVGVRL